MKPIGNQKTFMWSTWDTSNIPLSCSSYDSRRRASAPHLRLLGHEQLLLLGSRVSNPLAGAQFQQRILERRLQLRSKTSLVLNDLFTSYKRHVRMCFLMGFGCAYSVLDSCASFCLPGGGWNQLRALTWSCPWCHVIKALRPHWRPIWPCNEPDVSWFEATSFG